MQVDDLNNLTIVGCKLEDGNMYDIHMENNNEFLYVKDSGYIIRIETGIELDPLKLSTKLRDNLMETISTKFLEEGQTSAGFIFCKDGMYVLKDDDEIHAYFIEAPDYKVLSEIDITYSDVEEDEDEN